MNYLQLEKNAPLKIFAFKRYRDLVTRVRGHWKWHHWTGRI